MTEESAAEISLLQKGLVSYSKALSALRAFETVAQESWRRCLNTSLSEVSDALSVPLRIKDFRGFANAGTASTGEYSSVGLRAVDGESRKHLFYFWWTPKACNLVTSVEIPDTGRAKEIFDRVKKGRTEDALALEYREIYMWAPLPDDLTHLETQQRLIVTHWSELWRRVGGVGG